MDEELVNDPSELLEDGVEENVYYPDNEAVQQ